MEIFFNKHWIKKLVNACTFSQKRHEHCQLATSTSTGSDLAWLRRLKVRVSMVKLVNINELFSNELSLLYWRCRFKGLHFDVFCPFDFILISVLSTK